MQAMVKRSFYLLQNVLPTLPCRNRESGSFLQIWVNQPRHLQTFSDQKARLILFLPNPSQEPRAAVSELIQ